jgi:RNA polymerase-binding transcription factor DksA
VSPARCDNLRKKLVALDNRLKGTVSRLAREAFRSGDSEGNGGATNAAYDLLAASTDQCEHETTIRLLESREHALEETAAALSRLDRGTYGVCENCGRSIGRERLKAVPYTRHCINCARQFDSMHEFWR